MFLLWGCLGCLYLKHHFVDESFRRVSDLKELVSDFATFGYLWWKFPKTMPFDMRPLTVNTQVSYQRELQLKLVAWIQYALDLPPHSKSGKWRFVEILKMSLILVSWWWWIQLCDVTHLSTPIPRPVPFLVGVTTPGWYNAATGGNHGYEGGVPKVVFSLQMMKQKCMGSKIRTFPLIHPVLISFYHCLNLFEI